MKLVAPLGIAAAAIIVVGAAIGIGVYRAHLVGAQPTAQVHPTPTPTTVSTPIATATPTPAPGATPVPVPSAPPQSNAVVGTYWTCVSDQTAAGTADHGLDAKLRAEGGARSPVCQKALSPSPGAYAFPVPVGHFTPFQSCGVLVANIIDPSQGQLPPSQWISADEQLFNHSWTTGAPSGTC